MTTLFISHSSKDKAWAEELHAALVGRGYQALFLDSHPDDGIPVGDKWEQTLWQRLRRSGGVIVLCTASWLTSPWCVAEAMIARERGKRVFILAAPDVSNGHQAKSGGNEEEAPRIPSFLTNTQMISLANTSREEAHRQLWDRLDGLNRESFPPPNRPYPGLEAFQDTDAAVFFGRDDKIEEVLEVLKRRRGNNAKGFVLVLGASGCGKSSLVRAGVLPWLKRAGDREGSKDKWLILQPVMAGRGVDGLATVLDIAFQEVGRPSNLPAVRRQLTAARQGDGGADSGAQALRGLAGDLLAIHRVAEGLVLVVLDQLEEVFGTPEGSEARAGLRLLLEASAGEASPVVVLATMRSDFLNSFQLFEGAAERYDKVTLDPMLPARFAEVIEGPADRFGLDLDAGLSKRLVADTAYDDALPLLAFTLKKLYEGCGADGCLKLKEYDKLFPEVTIREDDGSITAYRGVSAAIKHVADKILEQTSYKDLPPEDERMRDLRRAFYRLAQVGEEGQFTRRTARWSQMPDTCKPVLQQFVDQRLLVSDIANGERILGVAHEALFRVWDTLRGWLEQDRKQLLLRAQIEEAAAAWDAETRTEIRRELVWPEARIVDAVKEIARSGVSLDDVRCPELVSGFLGPTRPDKIVELLAFDETKDQENGSGRYGEAWRLPLSHEARASVGVRLALLGDRRKGVGLRADGLPDIDWRPIEGGEVTIEIRANPDDPNSRVVKRLTRTVAPLWMARYPVTVAQFRAFVGECHRQDGWHLPPGFRDVLIASAARIFDLRADYPPPKHRARYDNYSADSVNWYDSMAFCHWLSARLGFEVRLPTEYEWQQAATGDDPARRYPWGPDWDPVKESWRANTLESDLGRSTAVGMYPAGASRSDILDMAGTFWEWCLDLFEHSDSTQGSWLGRLLSKRRVHEDRRVRRGGSWFDGQGYARSAGRGWKYALGRDHRVGFRVVCSSPS